MHIFQTFMLISLVVIGVYIMIVDIIAAVNSIEKDTFSYYYTLLQYYVPGVSFFLGGLMGHLIWPLQYKAPIDQGIVIVLLFVLSGLFCIPRIWFTMPAIYVVALFQIGFLYGHFLWGMNNFK